MAKTTQKKVPDEPEQPVLAEEFAPDPELPPETLEVPPDAPPETPTPPIPPKKNKGGRPTAEQQAEKTTVLDLLADIEFTAERQIYVYVYRIRPVLNHLLAGYKKTMVNRWDVKIDENDLKLYAGSGLYFIRCTHLNEKRERVEFLKGEVRILDMNHPPKIPTGSWVETPENKEWTWAHELSNPKPAEPAPADPSAGIVGILQKQLDRQHQENMALRSQMSQKDPEEKGIMAVLLTKLLEKPAAPSGPDPTVLMMQQMMKQQSDQMQRMHEAHQAEAKALREELKETRMLVLKPSEKEKDPLGELERVFNFEDRISERFGKNASTGPRSRMSGSQEFWANTLEEGVKLLLPWSNVAANLVQAGVFQRMQQSQPQPQQGAAQQPTIGMLPASAAQSHSSTTTHASPGPQLVTMEKPKEHEFAAAVLDHVKAGKTGDELGDWYKSRYGEADFAAARNRGIIPTLDLLKATPSWGEISTYPAKDLEDTISEFVDWQPPDDAQPAAPHVAADPAAAIAGDWN